MRVLVLLTLIVIGATFSPTATAEPIKPEEPVAHSANTERRVRSTDPRVKQALADGVARSAAFRDVLRRVEARDVIVYIEMQMDLRGKLAGQMRWVAATKQARYVRVALNPELSGALLIATLAHELEHVAEVGDAPSVVDERTLSEYYRSVGTERRIDSGAWDTEAAQVTGEVVRKELAMSNLVANR